MSFEHNKEIGTIAIIAIVAIGIVVYLVLPSSKADDIIILSNGDGTAPVSCIGGNLILAQNLTDLCDVVITNPLLNQTIIYNGSYWVNMNFTQAGETTICSNLGTSQPTSEGIVSTSLNGNCTFKRLLEGSSISLSSNSTHITITNTAPDNTACFNVGSGLGVYSGGECQFDSLIAGDGVTITDTTDDLTFTSTCENTGTGEAVCEANNNINSLISADTATLTITDTTGDLTFTPKLSKLCETVASGGETSLSCSLSTTSVKSFIIQATHSASGGTTATIVMRFNSDSGNNYAFRSSTNGGADATATNQPHIATVSNTNGQFYHYELICNQPLSTQEKLCYGARHTAGVTAGQAPARVEISGKWANTSNLISTVDLVRTAGTSTFDTGSFITVWGVVN